VTRRDAQGDDSHEGEGEIEQYPCACAEHAVAVAVVVVVVLRVARAVVCARTCDSNRHSRKESRI
jgi:hypothetical protein